MKNIFSESPEESLGFLLSRVYTLRNKMINEKLEPVDLNYVQYGLLAGLYWLLLQGQKVNQMMLINLTKLDKSVVSTILNKMVGRKIVLRTEDPEDTRAKIVSLTPEGIKLVEKAIETVNQIDETFWGNQPRENICMFMNEVINLNK